MRGPPVCRLSPKLRRTAREGGSVLEKSLVPLTVVTLTVESSTRLFVFPRESW